MRYSEFLSSIEEWLRIKWVIKIKLSYNFGPQEKCKKLNTYKKTPQHKRFSERLKCALLCALFLG